MLITVDPHSGVPVFRQIVDQIRFHVMSGILRPGDELPSTRTISAELGINPMTVSKAFNILEEEGLVERRPGLPLIVSMQSKPDLEETRAERLRMKLEPIATIARQLHIDPEDALEIFRDLLVQSDTSER